MILQKFFIGDSDKLDWDYISTIPEVKLLESCEQSPKWHAEGDVMKHTKLALEHAYARFSEIGLWTMDFKRTMLVAILLRDVGKPVAYIKDEKGIHNYGHEKHSADIIRRLLADEPVCEEIATYAALHMEMHNMITHKDYMERLAKMSYELNLNRLLFLHECDVYGSRCEDPSMKEADKERFLFLKKIATMLYRALDDADKKFIYKEHGKRTI